jgi:catechol 2,3-dioxygenase-like lactoylglutathione lyase family enzyme
VLSVWPLLNVHATDALRLSPVRRTTISTADPDGSLRFYRDLLGFTVEYDVTVTDPAQLSLISPGATKGRSIALRQGAHLGGSIGLSWTNNLSPRNPQACSATASDGGASLLLLTDNLGALYKRLKAADVPFLAENVSYSQSRGPTEAFTVFDPNCVRVTFAEITRETLDESLGR